MAKKILFVEDSAVTRETMKEILTIKGYDVVAAEDGKAALDALANYTPQLIISDIMMPVMNGYEFFSAVRENSIWNDIPFIFLTARVQYEDILKGKKIGVDDYLTKPVNIEELIITIESKLQRTEQIVKKYQTDVSELKNYIITSLSHEFKTPLSIIQGYTDLIMNQSDVDPGNLKDLLSKIKSSSDRINHLVENFLLLVNLENSEFVKQKLHFTDLSNYLNMIIPKAISIAESKNIKIHTNLVKDLPETLCAPDLIADAILRIISNSVKFSKNGQLIWIKTFSDEHNIVIAIADEGSGIPKDEIPNVCDQFYQVDREITEQQGTGLGLTIVKRIMEEHQGNIEIISEINKGTTVKLSLPIIN